MRDRLAFRPFWPLWPLWLAGWLGWLTDFTQRQKGCDPPHYCARAACPVSRPEPETRLDAGGGLLCAID